MITITNIFNKMMQVLGAFLLLWVLLQWLVPLMIVMVLVWKLLILYPEMLMAAFIGLCMLVTGAIILFKGNK